VRGDGTTLPSDIPVAVPYVYKATVRGCAKGFRRVFPTPDDVSRASVCAGEN